MDLPSILAEESRTVAAAAGGGHDTSAGVTVSTRGGATAVVYTAGFGWPGDPLYAFEIGDSPAAATAALLAAVRAKALRAGVALPAPQSTAGG